MRKQQHLYCLLLIVFTCCHWQRNWKWGGFNRKSGERPAVAVIRSVPESPWTTVLEDLLSRRRDVQLVQSNWSCAFRVDAADGYLSLHCIDRKGRILFMAVTGTDSFSDRQQGVGDPEGAGNMIKELQRLLDGLFREEVQR